jgi:hypothetical protein
MKVTCNFFLNHFQASTSATAGGGENIDEIVQDHDNFGTDENEDSLDSLALASGSVSISLYRPDSEDSIEDESSLFGAAKRKNVDETDRISDSEPIVKKKKKMLTTTSSVDSFESHWNKEKQLASKQQQILQQLQQLQQYEATTSQSESTQTTASDVQQQQQQQHLFMSDDHHLEHEVCSPQPADCSTTTTSSTLMSTTTIAKLSTHSDDETIEHLPPPSAAIVSWLDTFSRWSHADKIVAIDQLIGACHPTQVRHMMTVIEPQFQRDFISLLPKEVSRT